MYKLNCICVLCLKENINSKTPFQEITRNDTVQYVLPELMISCSEIPVYICEPCHKKLNFVYTYKKKCLESYNRWKSYIKKLQHPSSTDQRYSEFQLKLSNCKPKVTHKQRKGIELNTGKQAVIDEKPLTEDVDLELYQHLATFDCAEELDDSDGVILIESSESAESTQSPESTESQEEIASAESDEKMDVGAEPAEEIVDCTESIEDSEESPDQEFYQIADFLNCELRLDEQNYENLDNKGYCSYSGNQVQPYSTFDQHVPTRTFECTLCKKTFLKKAYLTRHLTRCKKHEHAFEQCPVCNESFTLTKKYNAHVELHKIMKFRDDKKFECIICNKIYKNLVYLRQHFKFVHEGTINIKCQFCNMSFMNNSFLKAHMRVHKDAQGFYPKFATGEMVGHVVENDSDVVNDVSLI